MRITTQQEFEMMFSRRSIILNRPPVDPRKMPRFMQAYDFSRRGLEIMLEERTGPDGSLPFYRQQVKNALKAWTTYNSKQVRKLPEPIGIWAEAINKGRAHVRVTEHECRTLNKLLDEAKLKESEEQGAVHRHPRGNVKFRGGVPSICDGRELVTDAEGMVKFEDNSESLKSYLDKLGASQRARAAAKIKAEREMAAAVSKARGIEPRKRLARG